MERRYQEAKRTQARSGGDFMRHFRTALAREWASFPGDYAQQGINGGMYHGQRASISRDRLSSAAQSWLDVREGRKKFDFADYLKRKTTDGGVYGRSENEAQPANSGPNSDLGSIQRSIAAAREKAAHVWNGGGEAEDETNRFNARIQGKLNDSTYAPDRPLTRAEILKFGRDGADGAGFSAEYKARQDAEDAQRESLRLRSAGRSALKGVVGSGAAGATENTDRALLDVHIRNPGPATTVGVRTSGSLFREIKQLRGKQMAGSGEDV